MALESALLRGVRLSYLAVEREPLPREVLAQILLPLPRAEEVFAALLKAWPTSRFLGSWGELRLLFLDVREAVLPSCWATATG